MCAQVIVVTVRPVLRVRFTHALRARPDTLPLLGWQFVVIQVSSSARIVDPVLAFGRQSTLFFFQVSVAGPDQVLFVPLQKVHVPYPVQAFTWLNSRTLATLDTAENLHVLDVRSQEELEVLDMSDVQLVYGTSHFRGHATGGNVSQAMVGGRRVEGGKGGVQERAAISAQNSAVKTLYRASCRHVEKGCTAHMRHSWPVARQKFEKPMYAPK